METETEIEPAGSHGHIVPYATFVRVWIVLLLLTTVLVLASKLGSEDLAVWCMLTLTPLKVGLVFYFFMHLKYESTLLKGMLAIALAALVVFIGLLFFDIAYR